MDAVYADETGNGGGKLCPGIAGSYGEKASFVICGDHGFLLSGNGEKIGFRQVLCRCAVQTADTPGIIALFIENTVSADVQRAASAVF